VAQTSKPTQTSKPKLAHKPYHPAPYDKYDVRAVQALASGVANEEQQKRALKYIIEILSAAYDLPYYPDDRDTAFACGRQYVGKQLVKLMKLIPENLKL
jgi:hypothetical protein